MTVFRHSDYKTYLKTRLDDPDAGWGVISRWAKAAGCQRSYLSRVLNGPVHLTPDQGFGLCEFWKLSPDEMDFFMLLLEHARSGSKRYQGKLSQKMAALRRDHEDIAKRLNRPLAKSTGVDMAYYSAWYWSAIHMIVSIPEFQTVEAISRKLQVPEEVVESTLKSLRELGFVRQERGGWRFHSGESHALKNTLLASLHHTNWRARAVLDSQRSVEQSVHFTVVQSMSRSVYEKLRQSMLAYLDLVAREAAPSKEEELVCLTCDLFMA